MSKVIAILVMVMLFSSIVVAGGVGPEAPMLTKQGLSVTSLLGSECAVPAVFTLNPACISVAAEEFGIVRSAETDLGLINFAGGPHFTARLQLGMMSGKWGAFKLAHYQVTSDTRPTDAVGGMLTNGGSEAVELSYGKRVNKVLSLGLAFVPNDRANINLVDSGYTMVKGTAKSTCEFRTGALYQPQGAGSKWNVGLVYSYEKDKTRVSFINPTTLLPEVDGTVEGSYLTRTVTVGASYRPRLGTTIYLDWQKGSISGTNMDENLDIKCFGAEQYFSKSLSLRVGSTDRSKDVCVNYFKGPWNVGVSYSNESFRRMEQWYGSSNTSFVWVGYAASL